MTELTPLEIYKKEVPKRVKTYPDNIPLQKSLRTFLDEAGKAQYGFGFLWLGIPIIQLPQDLQALQEIIWETKPDLIIETGIAWGGSLIHKASILALLEICGVIEKGEVLGIDIEIYPHNRKVLQSHPLKNKIIIIEGSSVDENIIQQVKEYAKDKKVLLCLDSNHTHKHVLEELKIYAPLVSKGSYCVVSDTSIENWPDDIVVPDRPWGKGNNPKTAVWEYLDYLTKGDYLGSDGEVLNFEMDKIIENKLLITGSPDGYLRRL